MLYKMYNFKILSVLFAYFCIIYTSQSASVDSSCAETISALPPDPKTQCCGVDTYDGDKLLHGNVSSINEHPWLAIIDYEKEGSFCGGALISGRYILTAAHCVTGYALTSVKPKNIRLGEYNTQTDPDCVPTFSDGMDCTEGVTRIPIEKIITHPEYETSSRNHRNDIALIKMKQTAPYTDFIRPLCLPSVDMTLKAEDFKLIKSGWGQPSGLSPVKLQFNLPFVTRENCEKAFEGLNIKLGKGQFCAGGEKGRDSCKGDGGMPLTYNNGGTYQLIGVTSFGASPCGLENIPGVYTNVYEYIPWINSNIEA